MFKTLIVEDNKDIRQFLNEFLSLRFPSIAISEASNLKGALEKVIEFEPNLVLMDISLPDGNGLNLTRIIKADHSGTIVVVITSHDIPEYRQAAFLSGASYFIPKSSLYGEEIFTVVKTILNNPSIN